MTPKQQSLLTTLQNYRPGHPIRITSAGSSISSTPTYGILHSLGYMTKERTPNRMDPTGSGDIHWSTTPLAEGITFINSYGVIFTHPHTETWEK